ncbi:surface-adhesin E family protein [Leptospira sp. WS60.C2]
MKNKKLVLITIALIISTNIEAKWKLIHKSMEGKVFIDDEFIQLSSNQLKVIVYEDLTFPRLEKIKSIQHLIEINCINNQWIARRSIFYSDKNLQGETIADVSDITDWTEIDQDSYPFTIKKKYCKK